MKKKIKTKIKDTVGYIRILNGMFNLTDKEIEVLSKFVDKEKQLRSHDIDVFSTHMKKMIAQDLGMDDYTILNVYIKRLKDKGAIKKTAHSYIIPELLKQFDNEESIEIIWQTKTK